MSASSVCSRFAQFQIQRTKRLVEQQHLWLVHQRASDGNALCLSAGQLGDRTLGKRSQANEIQGFFCAPALFVLGHPGHPQAEAHVLDDIQMREQCVGLEDRVDRAPVGRKFGHIGAGDPHHAAGRFDESTDHVQRRRLAATRRSEQTEELAVPDVQVDRVQRDRVAVTLLDATQFDRIALVCSTSRRMRREFIYRDTSQR